MSAAVDARAALLRTFRWVDGHADLWGAFEDAAALDALARGLADPWEATGITRVVSVEARGFLLGGLVAGRLGTGFQAIRKPGALLPGEWWTASTGPDYRGARHDLAMRPTLGSGDVVLMVDDWAERGAQAAAARSLVERTGARFAGMAVVVDQLQADVRARLGRVTSVITFEELPPAS